MGIFKQSSQGLGGFSISNPREILNDMLRKASGSEMSRTMRYQIFYQYIAFQGAVDGVGCSTLVANTAVALSRLGLTVCVVDTSILSPSQDILLRTNYLDYRDKVGSVTAKPVDWFDMGYTTQSVLNISKISDKISVLSFQNRTVVDLIGTGDTAGLVELALAQLSTKFDIILIDICHEPTNIVATCLQMAHRVFQVWSNDEVCLRNIENFIRNNVILSCSVDKMRYVITSKVIKDAPVDWDYLLKKYGFKQLGNTPLSMELAREAANGHMLYSLASTSRDVQDFIDCITDILCNILSIDKETGKTKGDYITTNITEGRNDGDIEEYYKNNAEDYPEIDEYARKSKYGASDGSNSYESGVYNAGSSDESEDYSSTQGYGTSDAYSYDSDYQSEHENTTSDQYSDAGQLTDYNTEGHQGSHDITVLNSADTNAQSDFDEDDDLNMLFENVEKHSKKRGFFGRR